MRLRSLLVVAVCGLGAVPSPVLAQAFSYQVRGKSVRLEVDPNLVLVKPKVGDYGEIARAQPRAIARSAIQAQAAITGGNADVLEQRLQTQPPQVIVQAGGILVPRVPGLDTIGVNAIAARAGLAEGSSQVVLKRGDRTVLLKGTVSVRFQQAPTAERIRELAEQFEITEIDQPKFAPNVVRFGAKGNETSDPLTLSEQLTQQPGVRWAEPDMVFKIVLCGTPIASAPPRVPNDTYFAKQWHLQQGPAGINLPEAWALATGTDQVTVAVLDDGVDLEHADLKPKLVPGYDYFENDSVPQPTEGDSHGTACAGLIGAMSNNDKGVAGVSWGCKIMPLRIAGDEFASDDDIAKAFHFARINGAKVISCSWGGGPPSNKILDAIDEASDAGCLVIAAAGNAIPATSVFFPASYERCVAVGAVRQNNKRWNYSCYGPGNEVDLVAPSGDVNLLGDILTTDNSGPRGYNPGGLAGEDPDADYTRRFGGTSAATPIVAGLIALVWSTHPTLTADQVRLALESTATKVDPVGGLWVAGRSNFYGFGKVDALAALQRAEALVAAVPAAAPAVSDVGASGTPSPRRPSAAKEGQPPQAGLVQRQSSGNPSQSVPEGRPANNADDQRAGPARQIEQALNPKKQTYTVRDRDVTLRPDPEQVAFVLKHGEGETATDVLADFLKPGWTDRVQLHRGSANSRLHFLIVPRSELRDIQELRRNATSQGIQLTPVYIFQGSHVVFAGTVTARPKTPSDLPKLERFAAEHGLAQVEHEGDQTKFRLTDQSPYESLPEAAQALIRSGLVRWAEPDLARKIRFNNFRTSLGGKAGK